MIASRDGATSSESDEGEGADDLAEAGDGPGVRRLRPPFCSTPLLLASRLRSERGRGEGLWCEGGPCQLTAGVAWPRSICSVQELVDSETPLVASGSDDCNVLLLHTTSGAVARTTRQAHTLPVKAVEVCCGFVFRGARVCDGVMG